MSVGIVALVVAELLARPGVQSGAGGTEPWESVFVGDRVRARSQELQGPLAVGRVVAVDDDAIRIERLGRVGPVTLRRSLISRLEVSRTRSRTGTGAIVGLLVVGVPLGASLAWSCGYGTDSEDVATLCGFAGLALGAAVGARVGRGIHTEKWEVVAAKRIGLAVSPRRGGIAAGLSLRF